MRDIIILAVTLAIAIPAAFLGMHICKKRFMKSPYLVIGWRKKNRAILRDTRLYPAYWKMHMLAVWMVMNTAVVIVAIYGFARNEWPIVLGVCGAVAVVLALLFRKSRINFDKLKDEIGVMLEGDKDEIKAAQKAAIKDMFKANKKLLIFVAVLLPFASAVNIMQGYFLPGFLSAGLGLFYIIMLIKIYITKG